MLYLRRTFEYEYPPEEADAALLGIPFDSTQTGKSTKYGPVFIREALKNIHGYDPETGKNPFTKYKLCDLGDVEVVPGSWKLTKERIGDTVKSIFETNPKILPIFLGGEHLITLGILQSIADVAKQKITVIHFDAHRDLAEEWIGAEYSHITWAYQLLKNQNFELVQIGPRSWTKEEESAVKKFGVKDAITKTENPVYITVDMDVFDPSFAPEVGTPEPLGISPEDFFRQLKTVCKNKIIALDIVECSSERIGSTTALLAAQIIKKFLCYL
jgi:agmatinase